MFMESNSAEIILNSLPKKKGEAFRLVSLLLRKGPVNASRIKRGARIKKIGAAVSEANKHIYKTGHFISCTKPPEGCVNQFGDKSPMYLFEIIKLNEGINIKQRVSKHRIITLPASSLDKPFIYKGKYGWFVKAANNPLMEKDDLLKINRPALRHRDKMNALTAN